MTDLAVKLLEYYDREARPLPFRLNPSPYPIWLSEIMSQQTRMETLVPYFERFIKKLPTIEDLAKASEEELLKLWEGLGYYSRVRNLQKAAQQIVADYGGQLPKEAKELEKLPGIGPYTAGAISSIAFGQPSPAIDGNVIRVFSRVYEIDAPLGTSKNKKLIEAAVLEHLPKERPGDFNQGIMEIGAKICLPNGEPLCDQCPIQEFCQAKAKGREQNFPVTKAKKARVIEAMTVFLLRQDEKVLLEKRPSQGILAGQWQFPMQAGHLSQEEGQEWLESLGFKVTAIHLGKEAKHIFSHKEWHMISYEVEVFPIVRETEVTMDWFSPKDLDVIALPTAFKVFRQRAKGWLKKKS